MSLWRNWLARSAVNRKVGGSSPPRDEHILFVEIVIPLCVNENNACLRSVLFIILRYTQKAPSVLELI